MTKAERIGDDNKPIPKTKIGFFPTESVTDAVCKLLESSNCAEDVVPVKIEFKEKKLFAGDLDKPVEKFEGYTMIVQTNKNETFKFRITTS